MAAIAANTIANIRPTIVFLTDLLSVIVDGCSGRSRPLFIAPALEPAGVAADCDDFPQRIIGQRRVLARDAARVVDEQDVFEIDFEFVAGFAHFSCADAISKHAQTAAERSAIGEIRHRFTYEAEPERVHRDVTVAFRAHAEVAAGDDDVAGTRALMKTEIGFLEQVWDQLLGIGFARDDQPVRK